MKKKVLAVIVLCIAFTIGIFLIPKPPLLNEIGFSKAVYDDQGHLLRLTLSSDDQYRLYTPLQVISPSLIEAVLLREDRYFYAHPGVNPFAVLKAIWKTYIVRSTRVGASTITMQLTKLRFHMNTKTWSGKLQQIALALALERHYTKSEILTAYLNLAPFGANIEGVGAASLIYFNQQANQLNLSEILTLSVLPQNPVQMTRDKKILWRLRQMLYREWLVKHPEDRVYQSAMNLPVYLKSRADLPFEAPHFVNTVLSASGDRTQTTLNLALQKLVQNRVQQYLHRLKPQAINNAAVLVVDARSMHVKAMVGSGQYFSKAISGQIDGTWIQRSPGSTLKPFIYGLALDQGLIHPETMLKDVPRRFGEYNPENFDSDFMGPLSAHDALILSRNIPAITLMSQLKSPDLYHFLHEAQVHHLKAESYYGLSLALGGAPLSMRELVALYAMLANDGFWRPIRFVPQSDHVADEDVGKRLLSPEAAFLVLDMLKDTTRSPEAPSHLLSIPIAWKTGTSSGFHDAWTVGVAGPYVVAVWLGHFDQRSNRALVGKTLAAPLFFDILSAMQHHHPDTFSMPIAWRFSGDKHLRHIEVCQGSGMLPTPACPKRQNTWFIPGKSPIKTDRIYREIAIDPQSRLRTCHIDQNTQFAVYEFWPSDILKIFQQAGIFKKTPPAFEANCQISNRQGIAPEIVSPYAESVYAIPIHSKKIMRIPFTATTDSDVTSIYWFINDALVAHLPADKPFFWHAKPGQYKVRVVDQYGLTDSRSIRVEMAG